MTSISVSMIVKNEHQMLARCLGSVKDADEIVIVDTGSEDNTVDIARKYTDKVYTDYKWNDDFADARNLAQSRCTSDWILIIDADEKLLPQPSSVSAIGLIKAAIESGPEDALGYNVWTNMGQSQWWSVRVHRNTPEVFWEGAIHNALNFLTDYRVPRPVEVSVRYSPAHNLDPDRALRILRKEMAKHPDSTRLAFYLAREYWYRNDYITAIHWYEYYIALEPTFTGEWAEACLQLCKCYKKLGKMMEARKWCIEAIHINPDFREAHQEMGRLTGNEAWDKFAIVATNEHVMFIRT